MNFAGQKRKLTKVRFERPERFGCGPKAILVGSPSAGWPASFDVEPKALRLVAQRFATDSFPERYQVSRPHSPRCRDVLHGRGNPRYILTLESVTDCYDGANK